MRKIVGLITAAPWIGVAAFVLLETTVACKAYAYRVVVSEVEHWSNVERYTDSRCSAAAAARLSVACEATLKLPTTERYAVWLRCAGVESGSRVVVKIDNVQHEVDIQRSRMEWFRIDDVKGKPRLKVQIEPNRQDHVLCDLLLCTTNLDWDPRPSGDVTAVEVEGLDGLSLLKGKNYSGGKAAYITKTVTTHVTLSEGATYDVWLRCFDNGRRDIGVQVDGNKKLISKYLVPIRWWKVGSVEGQRVVSIQLSSEGTYQGWADVLVFTSNQTWNPEPYQIDLLGNPAIPPDVPPERAVELLRKYGGEGVVKRRHRFIAFHYLDPQKLIAMSPYLNGIGWDGINTIPAQWYDSPQTLAERMPQWRGAIKQARKAGMTAFFVKKALSYGNFKVSPGPYNPRRTKFLPDWFDDNQWGLQVENFEATGRFAKTIGALGLALDQELYLTDHLDDMAHMWEVGRWERKGHKASDVYAKVRQRARDCAHAFLREFPRGEIMFFPAFYDARNPMCVAWYAGFFDCEPPGGIVLATERLYTPKGGVTVEGWLHQCESVEKAIREGLKDVIAEHRSYFNAKCTFAHGAWPLTKERANYNPLVFRNQLIAFGIRSAKYVWMYTDGFTWYDHAEQARLREGQWFDNSEHVTVLRDFIKRERY